MKAFCAIGVISICSLFPNKDIHAQSYVPEMEKQQNESIAVS